MFVMQLNVATGATNYIRQIGTAADDYVTDVACDKEGNALPFFTTLGSMYRDNDTEEQDVVVMSVSHADGSFDAPLTITDRPSPTPSPDSDVDTSQQPSSFASDLTSAVPTSDASEMTSMVPTLDSTSMPSETEPVPTVIIEDESDGAPIATSNAPIVTWRSLVLVHVGPLCALASQL